MGKQTVAETTPGPPGAAPTGRSAGRTDRCARLVLAFRPPTRETAGQLTDWAPGDLVRLQTEYTRLFVNGRNGPVAPAEAVAWLASEGAGEQSAFLGRLHEEFAREEVAMDSGAGLAPDHVAVLLELLWLMEARAEAGEPEARQQADRFVAGFLKPWIPRFLATLEAAETVSFYRRAVRELRELVLAGP